MMTAIPAHVRLDVKFYFTCKDFDIVFRIGNLPVLPQSFEEGDAVKAAEILWPGIFKHLTAEQRQSLRPMTTEEVSEYVADNLLDGAADADEGPF